MLKYDLPRRKQGARTGQDNPSYKHGRTIDLDGYVLTSAPAGHPQARYLPNKNIGRILEHRLVVENMIGRYLDPLEAVDHIDGLRLHNCPSNLRLFDCNASHLRETITGNRPNWSKEGFDRMKLNHHQRKESQPVDKYLMKKKSGDARLIQILLAALKLGIDSPYLLGTSRHLEKAGIVDFSHSSLERALADLYHKYA